MHIGMEYNQALQDVLDNPKMIWQDYVQDVLENILSLHMWFLLFNDL